VECRDGGNKIEKEKRRCVKPQYELSGARQEGGIMGIMINL
jgi:hypothetical protein